MTTDQATRIHDRIDALAKAVAKMNTDLQVRVALLEQVDKQSVKMLTMRNSTVAAAIGATVASVVSGLVVAFL